MPIRVEGPDGVTLEFPDGTSQETMRVAMQRRYGAPRQQPRQENPRNYARIGGRPFGGPGGTRQPPRRTAMDRANGIVAAASQGTFAGFGDEMSGMLAGGLDALGEAGQQVGTGRASPGGIGGAYQRGYQRQTGIQRGSLQRFRDDSPGGAAFAEGVGGTVPLIMTLGASAPEQAAGQAAVRAPGMVGNMARGATVGAAYGGAYGVGSADDQDLQDRLTAGLDNAGWGAALGAAAPLAVGAAQQGLRAAEPVLNPLWQRVVGAAERIPTPPPNALGALGGNMGAGGRFRFTPPSPPRPRAPAPEDPIPSAAANVVGRLAGRMRMSADDVEAAVEGARANPQGQVLADIFGTPGVRTTRSIAQAPGETGELATQVAETRFQEAPGRIIQRLRSTLGVSESRQAAMDRLAAEYDTASATLYEPLWQRATTPEQEAEFQRRILPLMRDPVLQRAQRRAETIFERKVRLGNMQGDVRDSLPRYLHLMKMGLDDEIAAARRDPTGIQATEMRDVMELRRRFLTAVEDIVPGYRAARERWGGLREAQDALDEGADFLHLNADEVQRRMSQMTPFQREHARIGLAHELTQRMGLAGNTVGNVNVANIQAFRSPEMQRRIAAVFDTPEQAADFLDTVTAQNRLMRNASQWNGGSSTYANVMHGDDSGAAVAEAAGHAAQGRPGQALGRIARQAANVLSAGALERGNNQVGRVLLRRIDSQEARAFTDRVVQILREREQARQAQALGAQIGGVAAGQSSGRSGQN